MIIDSTDSKKINLLKKTLNENLNLLKDNIASIQLSLNKKQDIQTVVTSSEESLLLSDNVEYRLTNISTLNISYPDNNFEVWMNIQFSSTETLSVQFPSETKFIGSIPTFGNGQTWEISIKDGVAICWRVE